MAAEFRGPLPPGNYMAGRAGRSMRFQAPQQTTSIVLHTVRGKLDAADAQYKDPASRLSAHYGVGLDGSVVQWVNESDTAYHADNWSVDLTSIGIQHEDDGNDGPRTDQLYSASSSLVREVCLRYGIPISSGYVVKHSTVAGPATTCPDSLDVDRIVAMASGSWTPAAGTQAVAPLTSTAPAAEAPPATAEGDDSSASPAARASPAATGPPPAAATDAVAEPVAAAALGAPTGSTRQSAPTQEPPPSSESTAAAGAAPEPTSATIPAPQRQPTGDPLTDIARLLYGDLGERQHVYNAIKGVVDDAPVLIQLEQMLSAAGPQQQAVANGPVPAPAQTEVAPGVAPQTPAGGGDGDGGGKGYWGGSAAAVFAIQIVYLTILAGLAIVYFTNRSLIALPDTIGPLSVAIPWFGALGAVLISLVGVTTHRRDWDPSYRFWHWARPFLGASFGSISVLIFEAGILAVGSSPQPSGATSTAAIPKDLLYYLVAFVVGYREETFRELIKKLADIIFAPGGPATALSVSSLAPQAGPAAGGTQVTILGTGLGATDSVKFGVAQAAFNVVGDGQLIVTSPSGSAGSTVSVTITATSAATSAGSFTYN